ncbi:MAG: peptidoglycan D,D-transpeptidase FtsI family protein [Ectothiorhodospira sp.]
MNERSTTVKPWRHAFVLGVFALAFTVVVLRGVDLQVLQQDFLRGEGEARQLRVVSLPAHRGMITDRNGEPLAMSTPVDTVWAHPAKALADPEGLAALARTLSMDPRALRQRMEHRIGREFVYIRRHVTPEMGRRVAALEIPGVGLQREYRRYYPLGEVVAHVLGFTNIDDQGQEGLELTFDERLSGEAGAKRVLQDRHGRIIRDVENIRPPRPGQDLRLTLDQRVQYLAYRELKAAMKAQGARAGSLVILDARSGEVLAMANQPSFNPNNRKTLMSGRYRNRAVTDTIEPGSTMKPFTVAAALESGRFHADSMLDTDPGFMRVGDARVTDHRNYGRIDLTTLLVKSSNVGAAQLALDMEPRRLWEILHSAGFGRRTGSGFPGEADGRLRDFLYWREVEQATMAFGYGLSVSILQLAQAYAALANDGVLMPAHFTPGDVSSRSRRVMSRDTARGVVRMLEAAVAPEGTGTRAAVEGYRVAGKTGTARKLGSDGYAEGRHRALFAGMAPASDPRLVMVVMLDEPTGAEHYGGQVAAPIFSRVMQGALRLLDIPPDDLPELRTVTGPEPRVPT